MTELRKAYVDIDAGQVHYRMRAGRGDPVVFLHQSASSGAMFEAVMHRFALDNPLYALDTPGFGDSFTPDGTPDMAAYGAWLDQAISALGIKACHMLGHHTGATLAVEIAVATPARLLSLAMIGPVVLGAEEREVFRSLYPKDFAPAADGAHLRRMWDYLAEIGAGSTLALHHREMVDTALAWQGHIKVYSRIWDQDFGALLTQVRCPLLLMCSEADVLWPVFDRAIALRPDARRVVLPGSNFQTDEAPGPVAEALARFIKDVA